MKPKSTRIIGRPEGRGTAEIAALGAERPMNPTTRCSRFGATPFSISVVITSCATVRALRSPDRKPYTAPATERVAGSMRRAHGRRCADGVPRGPRGGGPLATADR